VYACASFGTAPSQTADADAAFVDAGATETSAADVVTADALIDFGAPPACAKPIEIVEPFDSPLSTSWQPLTVNGEVAVNVPPQPLSPSSGTALSAVIQVDDNVDAYGQAFLHRLVDVPRLRFAELTYAVFLKPQAFYAELGCDLVLGRGAGLEYGIGYGIFQENSGESYARMIEYMNGGQQLQSRREEPVGAITQSGWYRVRYRIDVKDNTRADATVTVTNVSTGEASAHSFAGQALADGLDTLELYCGLYYADAGKGSLSTFVDDVHLVVCPE
jgi:hypothetical protein